MASVVSGICVHENQVRESKQGITQERMRAKTAVSLGFLFSNVLHLDDLKFGLFVWFCLGVMGSAV